MLTVWKGIVGTNATYENLIKACIKGEHADAGERICKYIQETTKGIYLLFYYTVELVFSDHILLGGLLMEMVSLQWIAVQQVSSLLPLLELEQALCAQVYVHYD